MSDETIERPEAVPSGSFSRRNALKAGAAVGVGATVWSGVSITSLGGTPAYAAGCTGVLNIPLDEGCRNTSQPSGCQVPLYAWHPLKTDVTPPGYPAGSFTITNNVGENECCTSNRVVQLNVPSNLNLQCDVFVDFYANNGDCGHLQQRVSRTSLTSGAQPGPTINLTMGCLPNASTSTHYNIFALCASINAPTECVTQPT